MERHVRAARQQALHSVREVRPVVDKSKEQKPKKPERWLATDASDNEARQHYSVMLDYYIAVSQWYERRLLEIAHCATATEAAQIARECLL
jgi:ribosomal protein L34E